MEKRIKMQINRTLIILILFIKAPLFAQSCKNIFSLSSTSESQKENDYLAKGVNFKELDQDKKSLLSKFPAFFISSTPPKFKEIMKYDFKPKFSKVSPLKNSPILTLESFKNVLKLFKVNSENTEFYFIGNGYYIPYLMAKALFYKTPMENRIKFLPISSKLSNKLVNESSQFYNFFKQMGISNYTRRIVVIDSVSLNQKFNYHSTIAVGIAIRNYFIHLGSSFRTAIDKVISIGMPEISSENHYYKSNDIQSYNKKLHEIDKANYSKAVFPYLDLNIKWEQAPFVHSWQRLGLQFYWNGKFNSLDANGFPIGDINLKDGVNRLKTDILENHLYNRREKVLLYREVIEAGIEIRKELQTEIKEIISMN